MRIDRIISLIQNQSLDKFHEEQVRQALDLAYGIFLNEAIDLTPYRILYEDVSILESNGNYYSDLPVSPADVSEPVIINLTKEIGMNFFPVEDMEHAIYNELDVGLVSGSIYFAVKAKRIWYYGLHKDIEKVNISIASILSDLDITADIALPPGSAEFLVETAFNFLKQERSFLAANDSTDKV